MFRKFISLSGTLSGMLWLAASYPALADWTPTFDPQTHVYVDPALTNSTSAPVKFDSELRTELAKYNLTNYYLVAVESSYDGTGKLSVDAADRLVNSWSNLDGFPNQDYALIVWARSKTDHSKGGFAKNVSPSLQLKSDKIDTKKIIRANMPRNPKGVMLGYVGEFESALNLDRIGVGIVTGLGAACFGAIAWILLDIAGLWTLISNALIIKSKSQAELNDWNKAVSDTTSRLYKIAEKDVVGFYVKLYPESPELREVNQRLYKACRMSDLIFTTFTKATEYHNQKQYQQTIELLSDGVMTIDFDQDGGDFGGVCTFHASSLLVQITGLLSGLEYDIKNIELIQGLTPKFEEITIDKTPTILFSNDTLSRPCATPKSDDQPTKKTEVPPVKSNKSSYYPVTDSASTTNSYFTKSNSFRVPDSNSDSVNNRPSESESKSAWFSTGEDYNAADNISSSDGDDY